MITLYPYQQQIISEIRSAWKAGRKSLIVCSPTGSGKTVIFSWITQHSKHKVLIITHRIELLTETGGTLEAFGIDPGLVVAGTKKPPANRIVVAMTGTLKNRIRKTVWKDWFDGFGLIIIDEAHQQDMDHVFPTDKFVLGFTATPLRKGKMTQLSDNYEALIQGPDVQELINSGYLVRDRYFGVPVDMAGVGRDSSGEFATGEMFDRYNTASLYAGVVDNWRRICPGTLTLVFCVNIEHTIKTAQAFREAGIPAEYLVSSEPGDRRGVIDRWKQSRGVLVNCGILTTGFNHKPIETIIVNRSTTSANLFLQMVGRGSRISPGKEFFYLLDFGENATRLGHYRQERAWSLDHQSGKSDGVAGVKTCPKCGALLMTTSRECRYCGYVFPLSKKEVIEVELKELDYRTATKGRTVEELELIAKIKGYKQAWIWRTIFFENGEAALRDYARRKGYHHQWVKRQIGYYERK
jgi:superfamily II DNA or RNA helicase